MSWSRQKDRQTDSRKRGGTERRNKIPDHSNGQKHSHSDRHPENRGNGTQWIDRNKMLDRSDRQKHKHSDTQAETQTFRHTGRNTNIQTHRQKHKHSDTQAETQTFRQTPRTEGERGIVDI